MKATTRAIQPITAYPADHISQSKCKARTCCRLKAWGKGTNGKELIGREKKILPNELTWAEHNTTKMTRYTIILLRG